MSCDNVRNRLDLLQYGEISPDEEELIQQHLLLCSSCTEEWIAVQRVHAAMTDFSAAVPYPMLLDCRRNLRHSLPESQPVRSERRPWWRFSMPWPATAAILSFVAFLAGQQFPFGPSSTDSAAYRVRSIEPSTAGRVNLIVEEVRQRALSGEPGDLRIRNLLLSASRDSSDPDLREETIDLLRSQADSVEVRGALRAALQHDTNAGVRLRALEGLRPWIGQPDIRKALAHVILKDPSAQVRTQAIDLLTQSREPELVGVLQEALSREDNKYVRLVCRKVLQEMNASEETF